MSSMVPHMITNNLGLLIGNLNSRALTTTLTLSC